MTPQLTDAQQREIVFTKQHFPYRIVFGVLKTDGTFEVHAMATKHRMNRLAREGHAVFEATR